MTIILAAFAPLMTVRAKSTSRTSPWNWATPDSANTYFGVHPNQRVMIGQKTKGDDIDNKLTINTASAEQAHILFKQGEVILGKIHITNHNNIIAGNASGNAGSNNVALGASALRSNSSSINNTAVGAAALNNAKSRENTAVGFAALEGTVNGYANTAVGAYSLKEATVGGINTGIGYAACQGMSNINNVTCVGAFSGTNPSEVLYNNIFLGNRYSTVYVLGYLEATNSNISSDIRLKNIQGDYTSGLEQIKKIKPVKFTFKDDKKKTPRVGVIAQDLQKIFPKAVMKGDDGFLKIRQEDMFYAMINAIKDLAYRDDAKDKKIKELEVRLEKLESRAN